MAGKARGEIGSETGMVANVLTVGEIYGMDGGWQLGKWRNCWWLVGLKPSLSISRKEC